MDSNALQNSNTLWRLRWVIFLRGIENILLRLLIGEITMNKTIENKAR